MGTTFDTVKAVARSFPEIDEETCYGTPALKVRGHHYRNYPYVLVRLPRIGRRRLAEVRDVA